MLNILKKYFNYLATFRKC